MIRCPAEKLSVTEMLKKRMREEEIAKEKPKRRRRSSVFKEHEESRARATSCSRMHHSQLTNKEQFPILSHLAKVVFAVTAASSKCERTCVCSPQLETLS